MQITVELPDDVAERPNGGREALEALVIEGYRAGTLSSLDASRLLSLSRLEFEGFLKTRKILDHAFDVQDFAQDLETLERLKMGGILTR